MCKEGIRIGNAASFAQRNRAGNFPTPEILVAARSQRLTLIVTATFPPALATVAYHVAAQNTPITGSIDTTLTTNNVSVTAAVPGYDISPQDFATTTPTVQIGTYDGGTFIPFATCTRENPTALLTVERYGQALMGPLYIQDASGTVSGYAVTDVYLTQTLESI